MSPNWHPDAPSDSASDFSARSRVTGSRSNASSDVFLFDVDDRSVRSGSSASGLTVEPEQPSLGVHGRTHRRTLYSDQQLREMAVTARARMDWNSLERELMFADSSVWKPRRRHTVGSSGSEAGDGRATVSTLESAGVFAVAAISTIPCSVAELRLVFRTRSREQFDNVMRCVYANAFLDGDLVHVVPPPAPTQSRRFTSSTSIGSTASTATTTASHPNSSTRNASAAPDEELSVKTMRFDKSSFLATREEWCFLESVHSLDSSRSSCKTDDSNSAPTPPALGRTLVTLPLSSCRFLTSIDKKKRRKAKEGERVVINYCFREDASGRATRVLFHGEFLSTTSKKSRDSAWKFVRSRLLFMAEQSSRFMLVARRRRLGMQVLVDPSRIATSNANCICCSRSFLLAKKRLCFLCGYLVCDRCSRMQQREFFARGQPRTRTQIEDVRLCVRCLLRVDHCKFSTVTEDDLYPVAVVPDHTETERVSRPRGQSDQQLTDLLQQSLVNANTTRKQSVMSVMKYLVEIERDSIKITSGASTPRAKASSFVPAVLTSSPEEAVSAASSSSSRSNSAADRAQRELLDKIGLNGPLDDGTSLDQCEVANADARSYQLEFPDDPSVVVPAPRGPNEQKRVETIKKDKLDELGDVPELDIICLIATKELQCAVSMVTLVESEQMRVLASTVPTYNHQAFPREQGFCSHTVLSDKPLLVPNVQADVRFSAMPIVQQMDVNFYCGFPLVAADDTVIGSVCCVDMKPHRLTRAQYATMKNLAVTASKVVQRAAAQRKLSEPSAI